MIYLGFASSFSLSLLIT